MRSIRHIMSLLLVALTLLMTGLNLDTYGAMAKTMGDCDGLHCQVHANGHDDGTEPVLDRKSHDHLGAAERFPGADHAQCGPLHCSLPMVSGQGPALNMDVFAAVQIWDLDRLSPLSDPDLPERPPNL